MKGEGFWNHRREKSIDVGKEKICEPKPRPEVIFNYIDYKRIQSRGDLEKT